MGYIREDILERLDTRALAQQAVLAGIAVFLPFFVHLPWITGPIVNAILILLVFLAGLRTAALVSCLPSLAALAGGLLPLVLAPAIPFIIAGNLILVFSVNWFYKKKQSDFAGYWFGVLSGAGLKFIFLFLSSNILAIFLVKGPIINLVAQMLSWSQLITAVLGGVIAWTILKFLKFFS